MQKRAELTRARLLEAGAIVFSRLGFAQASMNDIIDEAGITRGGLYFHFPSKESLAVAIVEEQFAQWPPLVAAVAADSPDPLTAVVALTYEVGRRFREDPIVRAGVRLSIDREAINASMPVPFVGWTNIIQSLLTEARRKHLLRQGVTPAPTARVIVGGFFGVQHVSEMQTGRKDLESRLDEFWKVTLAGISDVADLARVTREAKKISAGLALSAA
jgi:AcrR family transcriptional regulator